MRKRKVLQVGLSLGFAMAVVILKLDTFIIQKCSSILLLDCCIPMHSMCIPRLCTLSGFLISRMPLCPGVFVL